MFGKEINLLLQKSLQELPQLVGGRDFRHDIDDLVAMIFPRAKLVVIQDNNTSYALGDLVTSALKGRFEITVVNLEATPTASMETVEYVRINSRKCDALIAVGSGTINDLCKYASHLDGKPYIVFPTAASMNGFLSANASITVDGYKKTLSAQMPKAVFCDFSVIAKAPLRLNLSGLGDSLARPTAQFDWLLSHLLLETSYDETPFSLLAPFEEHLFENARGLAMGDLSAIELLVHTLLLSGLGMTIAHGSYPASQSEHMIAHAMGMLAGVNLPSTLHGEEIGVTTLTVARMQENILKLRPRFRESNFPESKIQELFSGHVAAEAKKSYASKQKLIANNVIKNWDAVAEKLEKIMLPSKKIEAVLKAAVAPIALENLGWQQKPYDTVINYARFLRDRFTVLDLE